MKDAVKLTLITEAGSRTLEVARGTTLLDAAHTVGIEIDATCGARGRCRSCQCQITQGALPPPSVADNVQLGSEALREHFRLACQTRLAGDTTVRLLPPKTESGYQILTSNKMASAMALDSGVVKKLISVVVPESELRQRSDLEEVLNALGDTITTHDVAIDLIRKLPAELRRDKGLLTATLFRGRLVDIEPGDSSHHIYGMAFDVGTTSIVGSLMNLVSGEEIATVSMLNPQSPFGADLVSRIAFSQFNPQNLAKLRSKALKALNTLIKQSCEQAEISPRNIYKIVIVGNTCMHHMLLGIDVSYLGLAPYAPVIRDPLSIPAAELPLKITPHAHVCTLPILAGFVGADALACVLSTRLYASTEVRVLVDIGTNGEMVMGTGERLIACSAPAGPAFEGAQIRHGMRGALGAIERVSIGADVVCGVIGGAKALGICGSGLIDACAGMSDAGVLDASGAITRRLEDLPEALARRIRMGDHGREFVLVWADETAAGEDISLTQGDIRQLQLAKSAIYSGVAILQREMNIEPGEFTELMLCGGFGNYVDVGSAVRIRLLPEMPTERISYFGNAALMGAQMALLSEDEWQRAGALAGRIEHISLASYPEFQDLYMDGMKFGSPVDAVQDSKAVATAL